MTLLHISGSEFCSSIFIIYDFMIFSPCHCEHYDFVWARQSQSSLSFPRSSLSFPRKWESIFLFYFFIIGFPLSLREYQRNPQYYKDTESAKPGILFPALLRSAERTLRHEGKVEFTLLNYFYLYRVRPVNAKKETGNFSQTP